MAKKIDKKAALASLNDFLSDDIKPVQLEQVRPINTRQFRRWVQRNLKRRKGRKLGRILKPLIDKNAVEGAIFHNATVVEDGSEVDVAILAIPKELRALLRGTDVFIVYADDDGGDDPDAPTDPKDPEDPEDPGDGGDDGDDNTVDTCQYMKCFCANPSNCSCVTATQFNKDCPDSACSSDADCGGGAGGDGGIGIPEVITVF